MTRKDNDFLTYWNDGFAKIQSSGKFKKLCDEAVKITVSTFANLKYQKQKKQTKEIATASMESLSSLNDTKYTGKNWKSKESSFTSMSPIDAHPH